MSIKDLHMDTMTSEKYKHKQRLKAMRENEFAPGYSLKPKDDRPPQRVREYAGEYKPRQRAPNEATPRGTDVMHRGTYRSGDGDSPLVLRPGAMDYKKYPSKLWEGGDQ